MKGLDAFNIDEVVRTWNAVKGQKMDGSRGYQSTQDSPEAFVRTSETLCLTDELYEFDGSDNGSSIQFHSGGCPDFVVEWCDVSILALNELDSNEEVSTVPSFNITNLMNATPIVLNAPMRSDSCQTKRSPGEGKHIKKPQTSIDAATMSKIDGFQAPSTAKPGSNPDLLPDRRLENDTVSHVVALVGENNGSNVLGIQKALTPEKTASVKNTVKDNRIVLPPQNEYTDAITPVREGKGSDEPNSQKPVIPERTTFEKNAMDHDSIASPQQCGRIDKIPSIADSEGSHHQSIRKSLLPRSEDIEAITPVESKGRHHHCSRKTPISDKNAVKTNGTEHVRIIVSPRSKDADAMAPVFERNETHFQGDIKARPRRDEDIDAITPVVQSKGRRHHGNRKTTKSDTTAIKKNATKRVCIVLPPRSKDIDAIASVVESKDSHHQDSRKRPIPDKTASQNNANKRVRIILASQSEDTDAGTPVFHSKYSVTNAAEVVENETPPKCNKLSIQPADLEKGILRAAKLRADALNDALDLWGGDDVGRASTNEIATDMQMSAYQSYQDVPPSLNLLSVNVYVLLSKHGDILLPASSRETRFQWSSKTEWYPPSIGRDGSPYKIDNWKAVFERLVGLEQVEDFEYASAKAIMFGVDSKREGQKKKDWDEYVKWRLILLQNSGRKILGPMLRSRSKHKVGIPLKDKYGPLNNSNSCALDCMLFIFPHLFWELSRSDLFGVDTCGNSLALTTPGSILFQYILQDLFRIVPGKYYRQWVHERISNYLRMLMQDISEIYSLERNRVPRMWFPWVENSFINLQEVLCMVLPRLFGVFDVTAAKSKLKFLSIQMNSSIISEADDSASLPELIHTRLTNRDPGGEVGCVIATIMPSLDKKHHSRMIEMIHRSSFYKCCGIAASVLAYIGYASSSKKTHFIAGKLFKSRDGKERIHIYDGLKNRARPVASSFQKAFKVNKGRFDIDGLVAVAVRTQLE